MGRWLSSAKRALLKVTLAPPKSTLEQRSAKRLLQKSCGYENQRVIPRFLSIPEFAYTFAYTPVLTTLRAPVYMALSWASALITREPKVNDLLR